MAGGVKMYVCVFVSEGRGFVRGGAGRRGSGSRADLPRIPIGERNKTFFHTGGAATRRRVCRGGGDERVRGAGAEGRGPGWFGPVLGGPLIFILTEKWI